MTNGSNKKTMEEKDELYEKYGKLAFKVLQDMHCNIKNKDQFEDYFSVVQLGLAKAINNVDKGCNTVSSSYFYTYMRNELINYFKYRTNPRRLLLGSKMADIEEFSIDAGINIEDDYIKKETFLEVCDIIKTLKPDHREIITRRYGIGRDKETIKMIADDKKISKQAVQQKEQYILKNIKKELLKRNNE